MTLEPSRKQWEDFKELPCWKRILEILDSWEKDVVLNLVSNERLHSEKRDNFPEVKFERGKAFAIAKFKSIVDEAIMDIDATLALKKRKEAENEGRKGKE